MRLNIERFLGRSACLVWVAVGVAWGLAMGDVALASRPSSAMGSPLYAVQQGVAQTPQADLAQASQLASAGQCHKALPALARALEKSPDQMTSVYPMALCLFDVAMTAEQPAERRHWLSQAETMFLRAQSLNPKATIVYMKLGKIALLQGDTPQAMRYYQMGLAALPDSAILTFNLASTSDDTGQHEQAMALYHKTLALDPGFVYAYNNLGLLYEARGQMRQAQAMYRRALQVNPRYHYARLNLGHSLARTRQYAQAQAQLRRAVVLEPDNPWAYFYLGDVYLRQNMPEKAAQAYEASIRLNPAFAQTYYLLALTYGKLHRYDAALQVALQYLRLEPRGRYAHEAVTLMSALRQIQIETARKDAEQRLLP